MAEVPQAELKRLTMEEEYSTKNPLVPFYKPVAVPPSYYDDIYPSHRDGSGKYFLRIGDFQSFIPPLFINVTNNSPTQRIPVIRQKESTNIKSGYSKREINITLWFNDLEQINGTPVDGPDNKTYYMDGLRPLLAQFKRAPFTPIVNEFLNEIYGIYAVTLLSITVNTIPEFPGCIQATLVMKEFNAQPFTGMPTPAFDRIYCWPIFRWYYQQMILDDETTYARTRLPKISTKNLAGQIRFKILPENILAEPSKDERYTYMDHDYIWMEELPMHYDDFIINSINIGVGNIVTDLQLAYYRTPTHQYLGSLDTMIELNISTQSRDVLAEFVRLEEMLEDYSRIYKEKIACGYLGVENELINMFGIETCTLQDLSIQTVDGFPGWFSIRISLLSYNKTQKDQETSDAMAPFSVLGEADSIIEKYGLTTKGSEDYKNPIIQDALIEDMISEIELYPDLELPTYSVLKDAVTKINEFRKSKGLSDIGITADDIHSPIIKKSVTVTQAAQDSTSKDRNKVIPPDGIYLNGGETSWEVPYVQDSLISKGYLSSSQKTGVYDDATATAVYKLSSDYHLIPSKQCSGEIWNAVVNMNLDPTIDYPGYNIATWGVSSGNMVTEVQKALNALGYSCDVDGSYGAGTKSAVIAFQSASGFLAADGIVGINTWGELFTRLKHLHVPEVKETKKIDAGLFVDPDFYIFYPTPVTLGIVDADDFYTSMSNVKNSNGGGMLDKAVMESINGDSNQSIDAIYQMMTETSGFGAEYGVPATNIQNGIVDVPPIELKDNYKLMFHDMYANNKRYTLCRAFPTVCFVFVDEGLRVRGTRMWSNYYAYHAVISASIVREKDNPVDVCEIVLSNIYHTLDTTQQFGPVAKKGFFEQMFLGVDKQMIEARQKTYEYMSIKAGCRLHLRMGYGSAPEMLDTVFNGMAASVDVGDVITIVGQSDGVELISPMGDTDPDDKNSIFKFGNEPSDIIRKIISARDGWEGAFHWRNTSGLLAGFSNGSKYGIEHFGYIFSQAKNNSNAGVWADVTETLGLTLKAIFGIGDEGKFSYDAIKNIYKGPPFYDRPTTDIDKQHWLHAVGSDEDFVGMYLYGKSPWDVFQTLANAASDYIATASPHQFRSTVFYGQPHWLYKYGFRYTGTTELAQRTNLDNYYELVKTYSQVHLVDSFNDIIDNGVRSSSEGVVTNVIPLYTNGETLQTDLMIYADKNIYPEYQRTAYYDTTAVQDYWGYEKFYTKVLKMKTAQRNARIMGTSYLQHSFRDMYKGEILILGDSSIKPHDIIFLTDMYAKVFGPVSVGKVVHEISIETGFTTSIKPDMITVNKDPGSVAFSRTLGAVQLVCYNVYTARTAIQSATSLVKAKDVFNSVNNATVESEIKTGITTGSIAVTAGAFLIGGFALPTIFIGLVAWGVLDTLCEWLITVVTGRDEHGIACIPLYHKDKPMIAGMKGYTTLIPYTSDPDTIDDSEVYGRETDKKARDALADLRNQESKAIADNQFKRKSTGIDIFNLDLQYSMPDSYYSSGDSSGGGYSGGGANARNSILIEARKIIQKCKEGKAGYRYGGTGGLENGIERWDCSAFAQHCYSTAGLSITRTTDTQYAECKANGKIFTDASQLVQGDLIFFGSESNNHHVAIFSGGEMCCEAASDGEPNDSRELTTQILEQKYTNRDAFAFGRPPALCKADTSSGSGAGGKGSGSIDGINYVESFPQSVITRYSDGGTFADGTSTSGKYDITAAAHGMPIGTKIYIPKLKGVINSDGMFTIRDTGGPFMDFDIFTTNTSISKSLTDVYVVSWGSGKVLYTFEEAIAEQKKLGQWDKFGSAYYNWESKFTTLGYKYTK